MRSPSKNYIHRGRPDVQMFGVVSGHRSSPSCLIPAHTCPLGGLLQVVASECDNATNPFHGLGGPPREVEYSRTWQRRWLRILHATARVASLLHRLPSLIATLLPLLAFVFLVASITPGRTQTVIWARGDYTHGQTTVPAGLNRAVTVAAGGNHSLALKADGTVSAWGYWNLNDHGQTTVPPFLAGVVAIAAGSSHSLALRANGTVVAWGYDGGPNIVPMPAGLTGVVAIAAGGSHSLALKENGTVVAWGANFYRQSIVPDGLNGVVSIAGGGAHSLALKADGTVVAWGYSDHGAVSVPAGLNGVVTIAAGGSHGLALKADGTVVAWGGNGYGQATVPAGLTGVVAITAGGDYSLALKADGTVAAWGGNSYGLSDPVEFTGVTTVAASSSSNHWLALTGVSSGPPVITSSRRWITEAAGARAGTVLFSQRIMATRSPTGFTATGLPTGLTLNVATGEISGAATQAGTFTVAVSATNAEGTGTASIQLVVTGMPIFFSPLPGPVEVGESAQFVALGTGFAATGLPQGMDVNTSTGQITGIGKPGLYNVSLTVSNPYGSTTIPWVLEVSPVSAWGWNDSGVSTVRAGLAGVVALAGGYRHSLALKANGTVAAWGGNDYNQSTVPAGLTGVVAIEAGFNHSLVLKTNGTVVAWGSNTSGQSTVPTSSTGIVRIAAGGLHSLALRANGTVVAWGHNTEGQSTVPAGLTGVVAIAGGGSHSLALKENGTVVAWGANFYGQSTVPAGLTGVVAIAAGGAHSLALKADGTVVAWRGSSVPAGLTEVVGIVAGSSHSLALKENGTIVAWGDNSYGQSAVPVGLTEVTAIATGFNHSMALVRFPVAPVSGTQGRTLSVAYVPAVALAQFTATGLPPGLSINAGTGMISGMPAEPGNWNASITMTNRAQTRTESLNFAILSAQEAYANWVTANWPAGGVDSAAGADPDMDGVVNLLEYAAGSSPLSWGTVRLSVPGYDATSHLTLTLDVPSDRVGLVTWQAQFTNSPDFSAADTAAPLTVPGAPTGMVRLHFIDPQSPDSPRRFGRLRVAVP